MVGYFLTNMKSAAEARIGDTFHLLNEPVEALPGFAPAKQMVFSGVYPEVNIINFCKVMGPRGL